MVPVFTLSLFACKAETDTEYVEVEKIVEVEKKPDSTPPQKIIAGENAAKAGNACVLLSWKNPADEDFYGTKITFVPAAKDVTQPLVILGEKSKDSSALIRGLNNGTEYTFSLFALDKTHNEAQKVELKAAPVDSSDMSPPAEVTGLKSVATAGRIGLSWNDPKDEDLFGIEITYKESSAMTRSLAKMEEKSVFAASGLQYIEVPNLANGTEYTFTVKTMDTSGNKSAGVTVKATPVAVDSKEPLKIDLSVPPEKSNKSITVTVNIATAAQIVDKVVYKKDGSEVASKLLADSSAKPAVKGSTDRTWTFEIKATDETANGTYTVAAIDSDGREETAQIPISNFDFTAPKVASGLKAVLSTDKTSVTLTWKDPDDKDFDHVEIYYVSYKGTDSEKSDIDTVAKDVEKRVITVDPSKDYYKYYIVTVDTLGNKSSGISIKVDVAAVSKIPEGFVEIPAASIAETESLSSDVFVSGRKLEIASLYMSDHPVTRGEYKAVMGIDPSTAKANDKDGNELTGDDNVKNNPVNFVSWYDALVYCNTLSIKEGLTPCYAIGGKTDPSEWGAVPTSNNDTWNAATCDSTANGYRLPTEAEWEWAARGGKSYTYAGSNDVNDVAWWSGNTNKSGTRDVKTKKANTYGLYDMSGNVWEWCWDWYGSISSGTPDSGPASGSGRCRRGGSWRSNGYYAQVANRNFGDPFYRYNYYGFRLVRSAN